MIQTTGFSTIEIGSEIKGPTFDTSYATIREYCDASLDYNPLHLDEEFMQGDIGKSSFDGVIVHGMTTFSIITRALIDWMTPLGGIHRRLETRWRIPVKPGDSIQPVMVVKAKDETRRSRWVTLDVSVRNQRGEVVATAEAMAEFPAEAAQSQ